MNEAWRIMETELLKPSPRDEQQPPPPDDLNVIIGEDEEPGMEMDRRPLAQLDGADDDEPKGESKVPYPKGSRFQEGDIDEEEEQG